MYTTLSSISKGNLLLDLRIVNSKVFPRFGMNKNFKKTLFTGDLRLGITLAVILIPLAIAYKIIAKLPSVYNLYSEIFLYGLSVFSSSNTVLVWTNGANHFRNVLISSEEVETFPKISILKFDIQLFWK